MSEEDPSATMIHFLEGIPPLPLTEGMFPSTNNHDYDNPISMGSAMNCSPTSTNHPLPTAQMNYSNWKRQRLLQSQSQSQMQIQANMQMQASPEVVSLTSCSGLHETTTTSTNPIPNSPTIFPLSPTPIRKIPVAASLPAIPEIVLCQQQNLHQQQQQQRRNSLSSMACFGRNNNNMESSSSLSMMNQHFLPTTSSWPLLAASAATMNSRKRVRESQQHQQLWQQHGGGSNCNYQFEFPQTNNNINCQPNTNNLQNAAWGMDFLFPPLSSPTTTTTTLSSLPRFVPPNPSLCSKKLNVVTTNTNTTTTTRMFRQQILSASISRAIRRRLHSMTRGSKLVPKKLPPIVIGNSTSSGSSKHGKRQEASTGHQEAGPAIAVVLPASTARVFKAHPPSRHDAPPPSPPTTVDPQQVLLRTHELLGQGAFATVVSVTVEAMNSHSARPCPSRDDGDCPVDGDGGDGSEENDHGYYACKSIREELVASVIGHPHRREQDAGETDPLKDRRAYVQAESQLAYEAHLLGSLDHPNIIRLVGFFQTAPTRMVEGISVDLNLTANANPIRSFLLTEVLEETLAQKLFQWRRTYPGETGSADTRLRDEKLSICQQLADALEHLHSHRIAYRDLKPENVGFSKSNTLKLFDFGLSREMILSNTNANDNDNANSNSNSTTSATSSGHVQQEPNSSSNNNNTKSRLSPPSSPQQQQSSSASTSTSSLLKGMIGTMRYMAPEVCLEEWYDFDCDLYSYAILCWEIWTHKTPYASLTPASYRELVCLQGLRPPDVEEQHQQKQQKQHQTQPPHETPQPGNALLPKAIRELLEQGWVRDPKSRIRWPAIRQELLRLQQQSGKLS